MVRATKIEIALTITVLAVTWFSVTGMQSKTTPNSRHLETPVDLSDRAGVMESYAWARAPWTGDDKPYQQIQKETDIALTSGLPVDNLLQQNKILAKQKPDDPQAQFGWAYVAWKAINTPRSPYDWQVSTKKIYGVLTQAPSPKSYTYTRLQYLVARHSPDLTGVGERLLEHTPNDEEVMFRLCDDYIEMFSSISGRTHTKTVDSIAKGRALALANKLIDDKPTSAKYYSMLAAVYVSAWEISRNPDDAAKALAAYQTYLKLAPPDDTFRPQAKNIIGLLQRHLSRPPKRE